MTREALMENICGLISHADTKTLKNIFRILIKTVPPDVRVQFVRESQLKKFAKSKKICSDSLTGKNVCAIIEQNTTRSANDG